MPHSPPTLLHLLRRRLRAAGNGLRHALAHPRFALILEPARIGDPAQPRPIVLVPGRMLVLRREPPRGPR